MEKIPVQVLAEEGVEVPFYATEQASGADIKARLKEPLTIPPGETRLIPTGIRLGIPEGFEIQVRPRSGLAVKEQVTVLNTPGTIDADYRGEIMVILINHGKNPFIVTSGMRIAQLVLAPIVQAVFLQQESLTATARGEGRFGHTGTH